MKKWILGVAVLIGMNFGLAAQQHRNFSHRGPAEHPQLMTQRMAEELKLTDEQKKQVEQLKLENATHQEKLLKKRGEGKPSKIKKPICISKPSSLLLKKTEKR